jgi:methyltransferase (TIGR00027 family)
MEPGEPSRTAMMTATIRGLHRLEAAPPWVFDDPLALVMVGPAWPGIRAELATALTEPLLRATGTIVITRARYTEERLRAGAFDQYVVLGAGLDTFAWRSPDALATGLRVFEVDHPASQAWKLARVAALGLPAHERHVFAPVNFETETVTVGLDRVGFDWSKRTFVSWLGVLPYLSAEANESTLRALTKTAPGSEVVLSYVIAESQMDPVSQAFHGRFAPLAASKGEPLQTLLRREEAEALVRRCGLEVSDHPTCATLHDLYFAGRADDLTPWVYEQILTAAVPA